MSEPLMKCPQCGHPAESHHQRGQCRAWVEPQCECTMTPSQIYEEAEAKRDDDRLTEKLDRAIYRLNSEQDHGL